VRNCDKVYGWEHLASTLMRNSYKILVGKPEGKRPFGRPRYRLKDNIKMYLKERGCKGKR
jgi:hypothetical protein